MRVQGSGFRVYGLWFIGAPDLLALPDLFLPLCFPATRYEGMVEGPGSRVRGSGFRIQGSGSRVQGSGFWVQGLGSNVQGPGFRVQGSGLIGSAYLLPRPNHPLPLWLSAAWQLFLA